MKLLKRVKNELRYCRRCLQFYFGKNWWAAIHIACEESEQNFITWRLRSVFGVPLTTFFFRVAGPFDTEQEAKEWITKRVAERTRHKRHAVPLALVQPPQGNAP